MDGTLAEVPDHVPPELVRDFDIFQDIVGPDEPHVWMRRAQRANPDIFYTPRNGGHWVITRRAKIHEALCNPSLFSSVGGNIPAFPEGVAESVPARIPITVDPPMHGKYRALINGIFAPKAVAKLEDAARTLAKRLIGDVIGKKEFDFVADVSTPLPVIVFMTMMDMPLDRYVELSEWVNDFFIATELEAQMGVLVRIENFMDAMVKDRIVNPGNDVISGLLRSTIDGEAITPEVVLSICNLFFLAGLDTVTAATSYLAYGLAQRPQWMAKLRASPELIPEVIEESLRFYSIPNTMRRVTGDAEFNGVQLKRNEIAFLALSVAGSDDREVKDPEVFDPLRDQKPHLAFSGGPHRCVGSHLARMEMRVFLEEWVKRMPDFQMSSSKPPIFRGGLTFALQELWLVQP